MSLRIVWKMPDGSVAITTPAAPKLSDETDAQYLDRIAAKTKAGNPDLAAAERMPDIDHTELPDRAFRNCWKHNGSLAIDVDLAKEQVIAEVRAERNRALAESDAEKLRLDEIGTAEQKSAILAYRQSLRDLPTVVSDDLDKATTIDQVVTVPKDMPEKPIVAGLLERR